MPLHFKLPYMQILSGLLAFVRCRIYDTQCIGDEDDTRYTWSFLLVCRVYATPPPPPFFPLPLSCSSIPFEQSPFTFHIADLQSFFHVHSWFFPSTGVRSRISLFCHPPLLSVSLVIVSSSLCQEVLN
ncbi:hypothetical protein FRC19_005439 [Serendipita sp. 401]|nr:hypothetical protein FRC19_005439 [Serendipita sp. 401]